MAAEPPPHYNRGSLRDLITDTEPTASARVRVIELDWISQCSEYNHEGVLGPRARWARAASRLGPRTGI